MGQALERVQKMNQEDNKQRIYLHCHFTEGQLKHEKLKASLLPPLLSMSNVFSSLTPLMQHISAGAWVFSGSGAMLLAQNLRGNVLE